MLDEFALSLPTPTALDVTLFEKDELVVLVEAAGFEVTAATVRTPYEFESQTPRLYVSDAG